jgi:general secretion pathway protein D
MQGKQAETRNDYDAALSFYEQALREDPGDAAYQLAIKRARFMAAQNHVNTGQALRKEGRLAEALASFERAYAIDPASVVAEQELRRTLEMIRRAETAAPGTHIETPLEQAKREIEQRIASAQDVPHLRPLSRAPINLKMNNQPPKVLYETVGKLAGINLIFDPDYQTQQTVRNLDLELSNSTLEQALDYLSVLTRSFWKPLSPNTIFLTLDNPTKRRDFEEQVVKVFYLENVTSVQELQEIATAARTITDIKKLFTYTSQNAIIVRGEADRVALAEKVIYDLDKPKSEVVIDVFVMEVARGRTRELAAALATGGQAGLNTGVIFTPRNPRLSGSDDDGGSTSSAISLAQVGRISSNDFSITLPDYMLKALLNERSSRVLQSPQVRSLDGLKASLKIGDRVPYATGSFNPGFGVGGGTGFNPLVSTQFQFYDVGVNVDITPKIHSATDVSLHVEVEISSVRERIDVGGLQQPVIGQRRVSHDIRIKEGQVNLIGGLTQSQESRNMSGIPGLSQIPILGRLFSSETLERAESELLIVLVPHIVRTPEINPLNVRGVATGSEMYVRMNYAAPPSATPGTATEPDAGAAAVPEAPGAGFAPPGTAGAVVPAPTTPAQPPTVGTPESVPTVNPGVPPPPQPEQPDRTPEGSPRAAQPQQATGQGTSMAGVILGPGPMTVDVGAIVQVPLIVRDAKDLFAVPIRVVYDPAVVELADVTQGELLGQDGKQVIFVKNLGRGKPGSANVSLNRLPGSGGINGSGTVVTFQFKGLQRGSSPITLEQFSLRDSKLQATATGSPMITLNVR